MKRLRCLAPGKVNLCLFIGRPRADGYHPLVSLVQPVSLADSVELEPAAGAEPGIRDRARGALEAIGRPVDARAEQLAPDEWRALYAELAA